MISKKQVFTDTFESKFSIKQFLQFSSELMNNIKIMNPEVFHNDKHNWREYGGCINGYYHLANFESSDNKILSIFAVELDNYKSVDKARGIQRNFIKRLMDRNNIEASIVAFYAKDDDKWRLSFIRLDYEFAKGKVIEKITPVKRYSYLVGIGEPCHTALERLYPIFIVDDKNPTIEIIENAFSVEKVTKDFFDRYKDKYLQIKEFLEINDEFNIESRRIGFTSEQFAKKLMGQLAFLFFIQKKGWIGVKSFPDELSNDKLSIILSTSGKAANDIVSRVYLEGQGGMKEFSREKFDELTIDEQQILAFSVQGDVWGSGPKDFVRLLFEQSQKANENFFDKYLEPLFYEALNEKRDASDYFYKFSCRIPFLNGGLFEPLDNYDWNHSDFNIPNEFFSNRHINGGYNSDGILDIFERYNFTMNEDEPLEKEVAIDPEMLGKIFENLLDVKDRKSKGAFYTPRVIVHYMCQEALINYLAKTLGISISSIRDFILLGEFISDYDTSYEVQGNEDKMLISKEILDSKKSINRLLEIDFALANVKIADPAVGSGAFPLGMLSEIVRSRRNITNYMMLNINPTQRRILIETDRHPLNLKLNTIRNSIYAVDIEPSAVEIAKLRLWLSIVVEQETNENAVDAIDYVIGRDPKPLPNLDYHIICGNSLVDEINGEMLIEQSDLFNDQKDAQVFLWQDQYDGLLQQIMELEDRFFFETNHKSKYCLKRDIEKLKDSIVELKLVNSKKEIFRRYLDSRNLDSSPFIVWKLEFSRVFREKGGFDIVIANPPYLKERDNKEIFDNINSTLFGKKYHQGKMDFWYYFLHKAMDIANEKAIITYITPRYWINSSGSSKLIKRIKSELKFVEFVDIGDIKTFDKVVGYHMIAFYQKDLASDDFVYKRLNDNLQDIYSTHNTENVEVRILSNRDLISDDFQINLSEKESFTNNSISLGQMYEVSQGVIEASDKISKKMFSKKPINGFNVGNGVFVLSKSEVAKLGLAEVEKSCLKHYLDGKNVSRFEIGSSDKYLIYSDKDVAKLIESDSRYTRIKDHLDRYSQFITSSNGPYGIHRPRKKQIFESPKIITPCMFKTNQFALDLDRNYVGMSFVVVVENSESKPLKYLLGILNSNYALYWFYQNGKHRGIGVDIGVDKLRDFPIVKSNLETQEIIIDLVEKIIVSKKEKSTGLKLMEEKLNLIIYKLYSVDENTRSVIEKFSQKINS